MIKKKLFPHAMVYFISMGAAQLAIFLFLLLFVRFSAASLVFALVGSLILFLFMSNFLGWLQSVDVEAQDKEPEANKSLRRHMRNGK